MSDSSGRVTRTVQWATERVETVRERVPFVTRAVRQLGAVRLLDSSTRLAAQAFLTAIPMLFVVAAFAPSAVRQQLLDSSRTAMGLSGASLDQVKQVYAADDTGTRDTSGVVGVLVTLLSATACSRALQRVCERSWDLPPAGLRLVAWRWLAWLGVWTTAILAQGVLRDGFGAGAWLGLVLSYLTSVLLWWWTQHLLLGSRVAWLPLLPGALLTGAGVVTLSWASHLYMPRVLNRSLAQFGPFGLVFTLLSWLIVLFTVVCVGISVGHVVARERPVARLLRTPEAG
ncbi:YhjD/YihY/BrkB family envelope integrity protein [Streptomyces endophyticus]|uniref:YihY/virulence factor BrkB family protein n=1 Tax=Streptomyces endophyticus TaxID=714166 RepID=A0ABU6FJP0_9ACTN|nr:YhjD/YihY/BrkB family envelope integrity protein [Streptomyces endophyticus]MEB8344163.1 YihY/virulence factor BrkB family protein [Streptomyces endophyticus]